MKLTIRTKRYLTDVSKIALGTCLGGMAAIMGTLVILFLASKILGGIID
ncbi:hypothetical protein OAM79_00600 [Litorivicinus sp.]|nr:hypothetical protein [Litorivicinus sp.]